MEIWYRYGTSGSIIGLRWGTPERTWDQWKYCGLEMGYPPKVKQADTCENIPFCRTTYEGRNKPVSDVQSDIDDEFEGEQMD